MRGVAENDSVVSFSGFPMRRAGAAAFSPSPFTGKFYALGKDMGHPLFSRNLVGSWAMCEDSLLSWKRRLNLESSALDEIQLLDGRMNLDWLVAHVEHVRIGIYGLKRAIYSKTLSKILNQNSQYQHSAIFRSSSFSLTVQGPFKKMY